jgi:hypothetical protein
MSGKQSAKPRFGGVFFCLQKSVQFMASRSADPFKRSSGPLSLLQAMCAAQWEAGDKHPSGMALKLLSIVQKHGLEVLA